MQATKPVRRQEDRNVLPSEHADTEIRPETDCPIDEFTLPHMRVTVAED